MRHLTNLVVIVALLFSLPGLVFGAQPSGIEPLEFWEDVLLGDEPLEFTQTVTTIFPGKESVTIDQIRFWSPNHWLVTRHTDHHGALIFASSSRGSWAMATEYRVMYESLKELPLDIVLNPASYAQYKTPARFLGTERYQDQAAWVVERPLLDKGIFRIWIDALKSRLLKEEFRDEKGKILYKLTRTNFGPVPDSDVEEQRALAKKAAKRVFDNQREWWHHVLLSYLEGEPGEVLLPPGLLEEMYLVAADKEEGGKAQLRFSDGKRVISIFQRPAQRKTQDYFVQEEEFAIFLTQRADKLVTIIGALSRSDLERIADSLRYSATKR